MPASGDAHMPPAPATPMGEGDGDSDDDDLSKPSAVTLGEPTKLLLALALPPPCVPSPNPAAKGGVRDSKDPAPPPSALPLPLCEWRAAGMGMARVPDAPMLANGGRDVGPSSGLCDGDDDSVRPW